MSAENDYVGFGLLAGVMLCSLIVLLVVRRLIYLVRLRRCREVADDALLPHLRQEVVEAMGLAGRVKLEGATLLVVGSRSESAAFPCGYFGWWSLNTNTGRFERL